MRELLYLLPEGKQLELCSRVLVFGILLPLVKVESTTSQGLPFPLYCGRGLGLGNTLQAKYLQVCVAHVYGTSKEKLLAIWYWKGLTRGTDLQLIHEYKAKFLSRQNIMIIKNDVSYVMYVFLFYQYISLSAMLIGA